MDGFTWVRHKEHGGYWQCPDAALDEMRKIGWEPSEAPDEPNPAVAEQLAWRAEQAAAAEAEKKSKPTKAASRGKTTEE